MSFWPVIRTTFQRKHFIAVNVNNKLMLHKNIKTYAKKHIKYSVNIKGRF